MPVVDDMVKELISWWCKGNDAPPPAFIDSETTYDGNLERLSGDDFVHMVQMSAGRAGFRLIESVLAGNHAMILFEAIDGVTGLTRRVAWLLAFEDARLKKLSSVAANVPSEEERRGGASNVSAT